MSIGHKYMFICPVNEQMCPIDIQMSIRPIDQLKCRGIADLQRYWTLIIENPDSRIIQTRYSNLPMRKTGFVFTKAGLDQYFKTVFIRNIFVR